MTNDHILKAWADQNGFTSELRGLAQPTRQALRKALADRFKMTPLIESADATIARVKEALVAMKKANDDAIPL